MKNIDVTSKVPEKALIFIDALAEQRGVRRTDIIKEAVRDLLIKYNFDFDVLKEGD